MPQGLAFTRLYLLVSALTLVFGFIDLVSTSPFMLKYEAAVSNAATGLAFVAGAHGEKPMIQEFAEQRESFVVTNEVRAFFRLFTLVWRPIFSSKARCSPGWRGPCRCSRRWRCARRSAASASG